MALFFVKQASAAGGGDPTEGKKFSWARAVPAIVFLVIIFVAGAYCAHDDKLTEWSNALLHSFQILLGGLVGTIVGEKAAS